MKEQFKLGDKVWIMYNNVPTEIEVTSIAHKQVREDYGTKILSTKLVYGLGYTRYIPHHNLFYCLDCEQREYVSEHYLDSTKVFDTKENLVNSLK